MNALVEAARGGSIRAASRLISCFDDDPSRAFSLLAGSNDWPVARLAAGVTGAPGTGKSRLINSLVAAWLRRQPEKRIGVLAVDPASPRSGGAVLGDRIRMMEHATDERVFIRSLSNRGRMGGLTFGIRASLRVMGLAGCDAVLLETAGVGQNEIEVAQVADLVVVVLAPGMGDEVQLLKSGLLEIADIIVVNKADRPGAEGLFAELNSMLSLGDPVRRRPLTFLASSLENRGVDELLAGIEQIAAARDSERACRRARSLEQEVAAAIREAAIRSLDRALNDEPSGQRAIERVLNGGASIEQAAAEVIEAAVNRVTPLADLNMAHSHPPLREPVSALA